MQNDNNISQFLRGFIMNEVMTCSVMLTRDVRMFAWMSVCNLVYCDETTNATNIPFGRNVATFNFLESATGVRQGIILSYYP
jgi:hypothetical protein